MSKLLRRCAVALLLMAPVAGACGDDPPASALDATDFQPPKEGKVKFDPNNLIPTDQMTDFDGVDVTAIEQFLKSPPYGNGNASFLETYQSNGVRALEGIINASRKYAINPIVFLVYAEAAQGLISATRYPLPPERVEYVFGCGQLAQKTYDPKLAGLDKQADCLGRTLRAAIDTIKSSGDKETAGGWGPGKQMVTLDGVRVKPGDEGTAAMYDYTPRVNLNGAGGVWIVWNIWNRFTAELSYTPPLAAADGKWLGEACQTDENCSLAAGETTFCATEYKDGSCVVECSASQPCPQPPDRKETFCARFSEGAYCLPVCNKSVAGSCRDGYTCTGVGGVNGDSKDVCTATATSP